MNDFPIDTAKLRRENLRWYILLALNNSRPEELFETIILQTMQGIYPDATAKEIRVELDYLEDRRLLHIRKTPDNLWFADLNRLGVDIVEYTVDCEAGIARPQKYWK